MEENAQNNRFTQEELYSFMKELGHSDRKAKEISKSDFNTRDAYVAAYRFLKPLHQKLLYYATGEFISDIEKFTETNDFPSETLENIVHSSVDLNLLSKFIEKIIFDAYYDVLYRLDDPLCEDYMENADNMPSWSLVEIKDDLPTGRTIPLHDILNDY